MGEGHAPVHVLVLTLAPSRWCCPAHADWVRSPHLTVFLNWQETIVPVLIS